MHAAAITTCVGLAFSLPPPFLLTKSRLAMSEASQLEATAYNTIKIVRLLSTLVSVILSATAVAVIVICSNRISKRYAALLAIIEVNSAKFRKN